MKKLRLYLDTTVRNFAFADDAPDHRDETLEFFLKVRQDMFEIFTSEPVVNELIDAPEPRNSKVTALLKGINPAISGFIRRN